MPRAAVTLLVLVTAIGTAVRVHAAVVTDFWFDEIWSQELAMRTVVDILQERHDNNHLLNTLWLHVVGQQNGWFLYRLPAVVFGSLAVWLAGLLGTRRSPASGVFAATLVAGSYLMIHYSSEARGYGPVVALSLLALLLTLRYEERPGLGRASAYWACALVAFLFHSSFFFTALACGISTLTSSSGTRWKRTAILHGVPAAGAVALYVLFLHGMAIGGGPRFTPWFAFQELLVFTFGGGHALAPWNWLPISVALFGVALECTLRWRERDGARVFFPALILLTPLITLVILRPEVIYLRYFLVVVPFLLLLCGSLLARLWQKGALGRIAAVALAAWYVGVNFPLNRDLLDEGRGSYLEAVRYIEKETTTPYIPVTFPPDTDAFSGKLLAWYSRFLADDRLIVFDVTEPMEKKLWAVSAGALVSGKNRIYRGGGSRAEWFFVVRFDVGWDAPQTLEHFGRTFRFVGEFPFGSIAGWTWYLFRAA